MKVSSLTFNIAWQIATDRFLLDVFYKHANPRQFIYFTHTPFFYTYPDFGKTWSDKKYCEFHQVDTFCHICGEAPNRNFAGYGTLLLQCTGAGNRMNLICDEHNIGVEFNPALFSRPQLSLF